MHYFFKSLMVSLLLMSCTNGKKAGAQANHSPNGLSSKPASADLKQHWQDFFLQQLTEENNAEMAFGYFTEGSMLFLGQVLVIGLESGEGRLFFVKPNDSKSTEKNMTADVWQDFHKRLDDTACRDLTDLERVTPAFDGMTRAFTWYEKNPKTQTWSIAKKITVEHFDSKDSSERFTDEDAFANKNKYNECSDLFKNLLKKYRLINPKS